MGRVDAMTMDAPHDDTRYEFPALLARHRGIVFKVVNVYCRGAEDRDDLAQDIAVQLWRAWPGYDHTRPFTTWMYRIALNVAISHVRGDRLRRHHVVSLDPDLLDVADAAPDGAASHENAQHVRLLQAFIARQPPLERALLLLHLEDRPQKEIAEILGITQTNVSTRISRLRQRIRSEL